MAGVALRLMRVIFVTTKRAGLLWPTVAVLAALSVLVGLGAWQWQRKAWKENLIATIEVRSTATPRGAEVLAEGGCSSPDGLGLKSSCEYLRVRLEGAFDHAQERHVFTPSPPAASRERGPGYLVFTPFKIAGLPSSIYVNRGYVPEDRKDPASRAAGQITGTVAVEGLLRSRQERRFFDGPNNPATNTWFLRDPVELAGGADGLGPKPSPTGALITAFYIDQLVPPPPGGLPVPLDGKYPLSNRHLEYALTWWGLALTLVGVYAAFVVSRLRQNGP